jgi:TonB family protein
MMYELCGTKCRPGQIALLRSGQPLAVLELVLQALQAPTVLIADQPFIGSLATFDCVSAWPRLDLRISRGLAADFLAVGQDHCEQPVIVSASALVNDIIVSTSLVGSQLAIIGGYALPEPLLKSFVIRRLVETLVKCAQQQAAPVFVHDSMSLIDFALVPTAVRIEMSDPGPVEADTDIMRAEPEIGPTLEQVLGHAQFLVATPKPVLLAMHMFMRGPGASIIVGYWRTKFAELLAADPSEAARVTQALQQLDELSLDRNDDCAKAPIINATCVAPSVVVPAHQVKAILASVGGVALTSQCAAEQMATNADESVLVQSSAHRRGVPAQVSSVANGSGSNADSPVLGSELKADLSLIYGKPGRPRALKKTPDDALESFGSNKKTRSTPVSNALNRPVSEAEKEATIAKIVRDVEAAAAIVSQDAIAQAVRKAEAAAAIDREQAVATAVQNALIAAEHSNAAKLAAAIEEAEAKATAAIAAAVEEAKRSAEATSVHNRRVEIAAAVEEAVAAAAFEKGAALLEAQAAGERATQIAVTDAIRLAEAAADIARARAVESAIARTTALAERAREHAVAEALENAAVKAEQHRMNAVQQALSQALVAAEADKAAAVVSEVALTKSLLEVEHHEAIVAAIADAAAAAEISLREAVASALVEAQAAAQIAKETAIARAVAITDGLAAQERECAVADALSRAELESKRALFDAVAKAVENARAEAALAQTKAVEQAVAQAMRDAATAQDVAIAQALSDAELAAQARLQSQALAASELKVRADAEFAAALARNRERISRMSLADIASEMSKADDAWRGKEITVRCCSLLRAMRQTSSGWGAFVPTSATEPSRIKEAYDAKLRLALAQTELRVPGNGGRVILIFSVNSVGKTDDVRIVKTSGDALLDASAANALKRVAFPAPPLEVGGDNAYTALLHFA